MKTDYFIIVTLITNYIGHAAVVSNVLTAFVLLTVRPANRLYSTPLVFDRNLSTVKYYYRNNPLLDANVLNVKFLHNIDLINMHTCCGRL